MSWQCVTIITEIAAINLRLPQWLHDVGSVTSVVSLLITIYIAFKTTTIARHYRQIAITPKIKRKIVTRLKNLENQIRSKNWIEFQKEASIVVALATEAEVITTGATKKAAQETLVIAKSITSIYEVSFLESEARQLFNSLTTLDTHIGQFIENKKWKQ